MKSSLSDLLSAIATSEIESRPVDVSSPGFIQDVIRSCSGLSDAIDTACRLFESFRSYTLSVYEAVMHLDIPSTVSNQEASIRLLFAAHRGGFEASPLLPASAKECFSRFVIAFLQNLSPMVNEPQTAFLSALIRLADRSSEAMQTLERYRSCSCA